MMISYNMMKAMDNINTIGIKKIKLRDPKLFQIKAGSSRFYFLIRIDILHNSYMLIYKKKAYKQYLEEISYEYQ